MIKVVAAFLLLLGSGIIFRALVAMDAPTVRPRPSSRRPLPRSVREEEAEAPLRRAA